MPSRSTPPRLSRRAILLAAAGVPLAGCTLIEADEPVPGPLPPAPDAVLRDRVIAAERLLSARYEATAAAHPELAAALAPFIERHQRHVDAVRASAPPPPEPEPTASPAATMEPEPRPDPVPRVHPDPAEALGELRDAEAVAAVERLDDCLDAAENELARVLAGVAACEASHDRLLEQIEGDQ